jgi:hypothetical protein
LHKIFALEAEILNEYIVGQPWMIGVILISLTLLAIVRFSHNKIQTLYLKSLLSNTLSGDFLNEENVLSHRASIVLLTNTGVFLSLLTIVFSSNHLPGILGKVSIGSFFLTFMVIALFFIAKSVLQSGFKVLFEEDFGVKEYVLNVSFATMFLGIVLIPITLMALFMSKEHHPALFKVTICFILLVQAFKLFKGSLIALKYKVNIFYFILYLCCFELIPILVLIKEVFLNPR